jgi:hypothetical protein
MLYDLAADNPIDHRQRNRNIAVFADMQCQIRDFISQNMSFDKYRIVCDGSPFVLVVDGHCFLLYSYSYSS